MTQEELEKKLTNIPAFLDDKKEELVPKLEWVGKDKYGFSRVLKVITQNQYIFYIE